MIAGNNASSTDERRNLACDSPTVSVSGDDVETVEEEQGNSTWIGPWTLDLGPRTFDLGPCTFDLGPPETTTANPLCPSAVLSHLISQLRPGADLSRVVLPTFILEPRSMLERITKCVR